MADAICSAVVSISGGATLADALAALASGEGVSMAEGFKNKLFVAYQPVA